MKRNLVPVSSLFAALTQKDILIGHNYMTRPVIIYYSLYILLSIFVVLRYMRIRSCNFATKETHFYRLARANKGVRPSRVRHNVEKDRNSTQRHY